MLEDDLIGVVEAVVLVVRKAILIPTFCGAANDVASSGEGGDERAD
jgi:hypothetical protein